MPAELEVNRRAIVDLLRSDAVVRDLRARAARIAAVAGRGMAVDSDVGRTRARAWVWTDTPEAMVAEATDRRLTRALDGGRSAPPAAAALTYTTKAGKTREATSAQIANWTRGGR